MDNQRTFTGTLNIPSGNSSHDGQRTITISAQDLVGNQILQLSSGTTQINPATQLIRDSSGSMQGTGGPDTLHRVFFGSIPLLVSKIFLTFAKNGYINQTFSNFQNKELAYVS